MNKGQTEKIVIVGAGSAGLSAAIELAKAGVASTVVDENVKLGGVVYRGAVRHQDIAYPHLDKSVRDRITEMPALYEKYKDLINLQLNTQVLGSLGEGHALGVLKKGHFESINYDHIIATTGCYERAIQFPGWNLPGVITLGCAQLQIKSGLVQPGQRMVLVGTGPLLPVAAKQLHLAGVNVLGVYEAGRFSTLAKATYQLLHNPKLLKQGLLCMSYLKREGIPFHYGWGVVAAEGQQQVDEVVVAPYNADWKPDISQQQTLKVDSLATGYGFVPRTELTQLLGIDHHADRFTGYQATVDENYRTSKPNVYVAGDVSGFYGAQVASESGRIAALSCLFDRGMITLNQFKEKAIAIKRSIQRYKTFQSSFHHFSEIKPGLLTLPKDDTLICRCENVDKATLDKALANGVKDYTSLKMQTRIGMGDCQGKVCTHYCYQYLQEKLDKTPEEVGRLRSRFPLVPLPFNAIYTEGDTNES